MPTKAECSAVAFSEASAYGLPIFTHDTGGVANYAVNGKNGYRLTLGSSARDFAQKIKECVISNELEMLQQGCYEMYKSHLSWDAWINRMTPIVEKYRK